MKIERALFFNSTVIKAPPSKPASASEDRTLSTVQQYNLNYTWQQRAWLLCSYSLSIWLSTALKALRFHCINKQLTRIFPPS